MDINAIPLYCKAENASGLETADGAVMPISGIGIIVRVEVNICGGESASLISVNQICVDRNA